MPFDLISLTQMSLFLSHFDTFYLIFDTFYLILILFITSYLLCSLFNPFILCQKWRGKGAGRGGTPVNQSSF